MLSKCNFFYKFKSFFQFEINFSPFFQSHVKNSTQNQTINIILFFQANNDVFFSITVERSGKSLKSETEILSELPSDAADRTLEIAGMLYESAANFFQSHSLKVNAPEGGLSRALTEGKAIILRVTQCFRDQVVIDVTDETPTFLFFLRSSRRKRYFRSRIF